MKISRRVFPVVHHAHMHVDLSVAQMALAKKSGADGVFLISHTCQDQELKEVFRAFRDMGGHLDGFKVGVNYLSLSQSPIESVSRAIREGFDMVWMDYAGISSVGVTEEAIRVRELNDDKKIEIFASVAFKYQAPEINPNRAAVNAWNIQTIPTTSGVGTGSAPEIEKIKGMYDAIKRQDMESRLAIASGMTVENMDLFLPKATDFLVSTGISTSFHNFDEDRLKSVVNKVKGFNIVLSEN